MDHHETKSKNPRTIDPFLRRHNETINNGIHKDVNGTNDNEIILRNLPLPCSLVPPSAKSLEQCALHEIKNLEDQIVNTYTADNNTSIEMLSQIEAMEDSLDDGFVLCDLAVIQNKLKAWHKLFPRIKPFFALKCNPDPMVSAVLGYFKNEVGFDCASPMEIRLALFSSALHDPLYNSNHKKSNDISENEASLRCIYANPQRADSDLKKALDMNVEALTFDGEEELWKVKAAHDRRVQLWRENVAANIKANDDMDPSIIDPNDKSKANAKAKAKSKPKPKPPEMIIRLLVPDEHSSIPLGEKFGANPDPKNIHSLVTLACQLKLPIIGISFHCGSGCHDPQAYATAIHLAYDTIKIVNPILIQHHFNPCLLLDIGGGFPGVDGAGADYGRFSGIIHESKLSNDLNHDMTLEEESAADIAAVVTPLIDKLFPFDSNNPFYIISEPGRYFVEEAFAVCSRIYSTQIIDDVRHYYIAQGVQGVFKDVILCGEQFNPVALSMNHNIEKNDEHQNNHKLPKFSSVVHGPSGEYFDIVNPNCSLPDLKEGDWLIFDRMGAYTLSIAARSGKLPIRYVVGGGGFTE